jgi:hypothetical protein
MSAPGASKRVRDRFASTSHSSPGTAYPDNIRIERQAIPWSHS